MAVDPYGRDLGVDAILVPVVVLEGSKIRLRDFVEADRSAFIALADDEAMFTCMKMRIDRDGTGPTVRMSSPDVGGDAREIRPPRGEKGASGRRGEDHNGDRGPSPRRPRR